MTCYLLECNFDICTPALLNATEFFNQGNYIQLEALSLVLRHTCVGHGQISNGLFLLAEAGLKQWSQTTTAVNVSPPNSMDTLKIQPNTVVARLKKSKFSKNHQNWQS